MTFLRIEQGFCHIVEALLFGKESQAITKWTTALPGCKVAVNMFCYLSIFIKENTV